jgi:hypothetical protein
MKALGSKLAPPWGIIDFPYMYLGFLKKRFSSKKTQRARA